MVGLSKWRRQPSIRLATAGECGECFALYFSKENVIALTTKCDEKMIVTSLVHELTHWAQTLGMSRREIAIENALYGVNEEKLGRDWFDVSVIERMADYVENECVGKPKMGKTKSKYKEPSVSEYWLCIGDIHCGSEVAPMPEEVNITLTTGDKRVIRPNEAQVKLNAKWKEMIGGLPQLTGVIVNGDACDGNNRKSIGRGDWTTDLKVQAHACAELLKPIKNKMWHPENFFFTLGSEYHVVDDRPLDQFVCDLLGGSYQPEQIIPMLHGDFTVQVHHYISTSTGSWQYLTTAPAKDHMLMALYADVAEYGDVNWIIRSHRHVYTEVRFGASRGGTILPGWMGKNEFLVRKGIITVPKIGYCLLKIYEDGTAQMVPYLSRVLQPCKRATVSYNV